MWGVLLLVAAATAAVDPWPSPIFLHQRCTDSTCNNIIQNTTYPTNRCIPCRFDHHGVCTSAKIECQSGHVIEKLWSTSPDCSGPATTEGITVGGYCEKCGFHVRLICPKKKRYSPFSVLNMTRFTPKLLKEKPDLFHNKEEVDETVKEYKRMLILAQRYPGLPVVPSKRVDEVWHQHILDTRSYQSDCQRMFGFYLHHAPSFGEDVDEQPRLQRQFQEMLVKYTESFKTEAPLTIWPRPEQHPEFTMKCCSAACVKPACDGCVGCDLINCGTLTITTPSPFGEGYIPSPGSKKPLSYQCVIRKIGGLLMDVEYTVSQDVIHIRQSMNQSGWMGFGLSAPTGGPQMAGSDFMISLYTRNYTGVFDLYNPNAWEAYPCWDFLTKCTDGEPKNGTENMINPETKRVGKSTIATWSRKLDTGDSKDWPIPKAGKIPAIFAHGTEDYFTQHSVTNRAAGTWDVAGCQFVPL